MSEWQPIETAPKDEKEIVMEYLGTFGAVKFYMVEPGTEVECNLTHQKLTVTDAFVVFGGGIAWCTPKVFQVLKDDPRSAINSY